MATRRQATPQGRPAQRRRTRSALLAAAVQLVRDGHALPTVAEVAAVADVSRRTAYRYFPTAEQLATEAVLETLGPHLDPAVLDTQRRAGVPARVEATVRRMQESAVEHERLLRTMIRLTVDRLPPPRGERHAASRGSRRVRWLAEAVAPMRRQLDAASYERLLSALSLCVGAEALIVLRDIRGMSTSAAIELSVWTAQAILRAAINDARGRRGPKGGVDKPTRRDGAQALR